MRNVTYSLAMSLDGYVTDTDGSLDWSAPDEELFRFATEEVRRVGVHLLGRRLYETMRYWDEQDPAGFTPDERTFADLWNPLPKVVFSASITEVDASARLATGTLQQEIAALRAQPGEGSIGIGGANLAAQAADLDLIDEYHVRVCPVLLGGGTPFFAHHGHLSRLELVESRSFDSGVVYLGYRVLH
ncbi:dihydrofolate reductase family protein [Aestuariimicrobium sp. Y1814]|uniref:dihydrofolate reductase family protein n=1 Tax=Aestuariimicrobium sp. Y1814 TaxID=3418742 RepID=UPI003DA79758